MPQPTILDRTINFLSRIRVDESAELLNELQTIKLMSLNESGVINLKLSALKNARAHASKVYTALEELDCVDDALALVSMISREIADVERAEASSH